MDPNQCGYDFSSPFMMMGQDGATNGCQCGTCRGVREQAMHQQPGKASAKQKDPVDINDGLNNLRLSNVHPMMHQPKNGQRQQPHQQQQHATPHPPPVSAPSYGGSGQNVYIWPCGVSNITFPIVDYTRNPFAATGFPGPLFYMATLPNTAKISDLVARLAPPHSGKALMARSRTGGECFDAASASCLVSLQQWAMQLEVWTTDDGGSESGSGDRKSSVNPRVTSASTTKTNQSKKSKGKQNHPARSSPSHSSSPDMLNEEDKEEADARRVQAAEPRKRSTSSGRGGNDAETDTETIVHHHPRTSRLSRCLRTFRR
ncbi:hypothetical protein PG991_011831 [Apiospora marii]|uniref:Uncharacterized protein n=1 Tax=Apiospora marii TaxID=335849 RepID=A0ABR1RFN9_9PEZI